jgi:hypothetical protein
VFVLFETILPQHYDLSAIVQRLVSRSGRKPSEATTAASIAKISG